VTDTSLMSGSGLFDCVTANCAADRQNLPEQSMFVHLSHRKALSPVLKHRRAFHTVTVCVSLFNNILSLRSRTQNLPSVRFFNQISCSFCNEPCWIILRAALAAHLTIPEFIVLESRILEAELQPHMLSLCGGVSISGICPFHHHPF